MLRVYSCIMSEHDLRLVALAAAICLVAAFTAFTTYQHANERESRRTLWLALAAIVSGTGIWATHFVAMLSYHPGLPIAYDFVITAASIATAIIVTSCGWAVSMRGGYQGPVFGGLLIASGIGAMHYIGMSAVYLPGRIEWDEQLVLVSLFVGALLSIAALASQRRRPDDIPWRAAGLLTLAICSLHFISMAAAIVYPDPRIGVPAGTIENATLAAIVTAAAILILTISFGVVLFDRSLARQRLREAERLKGLADEIIEGAAERERLSMDLKRQAEISAAALDNMAQGLSMYDQDNRLITYNRRYAELYGIPEGFLMVGRSYAEVLEYLIENGTFPGSLSSYVHQISNSNAEANQTEVELGSGRIIDVQRRRLPDGGWVATHEDITQRRVASERIAFLAKHDALTGLANRVSFADDVRAATAELPCGSRFAVHTIDLDRFKEVNDTLGHQVGDQILMQAAARLTGIAGPDDLLTRLGGDEFAVIQRSLTHPSDAEDLAARMIAALSEPFESDGHMVAIGASVGIALAPQDGSEGDDLLKKSDLALYRAKGESRGSFRRFEEGMDARLRDRRELELGLRLAIQTGQLELHYQPTLNLSAKAITGFEALIRWRHPTRGMIEPADFIPAAEESGLIIPIGEWVLRQACRDAAAWPADIRVAVNLSAAQFKRGDIVAVTKSALAAAGLAPERLELEITESVLLHDEAWVRSVLQSIRDLGVQIAMDDFGTGYSSLSYLRSFPFTKIKIDRAFVSDLSKTSEGLAIIQATIQLSEKLGMATTAEGVETPEQMNILLSERCTEIQGFHISRAVPLSGVNELIRRYGRKSLPKGSEAA